MITTDNAETLRLAEQRIAELEARCAELLDKLKAAEIEAYNTKAERDRWKAAAEAWLEEYSPCAVDPNYPNWCLTHHCKNCGVEEARRLTALARGEKP